MSDANGSTDRAYGYTSGICDVWRAGDCPGANSTCGRGRCGVCPSAIGWPEMLFLRCEEIRAPQTPDLSQMQELRRPFVFYFLRAPGP
jgi:hypothetical protein